MMDVTLLAQKPTFSQLLARAILKVVGWQVVGNFPNIPKFVMLGAPHTSNWDFPLAMLLMFSTGVRFRWIGKASLFRAPFGAFFRRLGGIPVRRESSTNMVAQVVEIFKKAERLIIAIAPEGTRSKSPYWKTGFYYMAMGAEVPIVLGFVDYRLKQVGIGPVLYPSGDIQADFLELRNFYGSKTGLYPEKQGAIELRPDE